MDAQDQRCAAADHQHFRGLVAGGAIHDNTLIWNAGTKSWEAAERLTPYCALKRKPASKRTDLVGANLAAEPTGIGGLLVLPVLKTVLSPFAVAYILFLDFQSVPQSSSNELSNFVLIYFTALLFDATLLVGWIVAAVLALRHKRQYPIVFVGLIALGFGGGCLMVYIISIYEVAFDNKMEDVIIRQLILQLVSLVIWGPYMFLSRRVRNTFVN
jgi:Protein of unknown function (DUF2569)